MGAGASLQQAAPATYAEVAKLSVEDFAAFAKASGCEEAGVAAMRENELNAGLLCECDLATVREIDASLGPWFKKYCSKFYALRVDVELIGGAVIVLISCEKFCFSFFWSLRHPSVVVALLRRRPPVIVFFIILLSYGFTESYGSV